MTRMDPWSEFLHRLLVTASLTDSPSAPPPAERVSAAGESSAAPELAEAAPEPAPRN
jgi:hypothetical protein